MWALALLGIVVVVFALRAVVRYAAGGVPEGAVRVCIEGVARPMFDPLGSAATYATADDAHLSFARASKGWGDAFLLDPIPWRSLVAVRFDDGWTELRWNGADGRMRTRRVRAARFADRDLLLRAIALRVPELLERAADEIGARRATPLPPTGSPGAGGESDTPHADLSIGDGVRGVGSSLATDATLPRSRIPRSGLGNGLFAGPQHDADDPPQTGASG